MRLKTQLVLLVAVAVSIAGLLVAYSMNEVRKTYQAFAFSVDTRMGSIKALSPKTDLYNFADEIGSMVATAAITPGDALRQIDAAVAAADQGWKDYLVYETIPEEDVILKGIDPLLAAADAAVAEMRARLARGQVAGIDQYLSSTAHHPFEAATEPLRELTRLQYKAAELDKAAAKENYEASLRNSLLMLAAGLVVTAVLAWLTIKSVLGKLGADPAESTVFAGRVADGDLHFALDASSLAPGSLMAALGRMKHSLLTSKLDYEGQLEAIGKEMAVIEFSPDGVVVKANGNFLKATGYTQEELRGQHHRTLVTPAEQQSADYAQFWERLRRGETQSGTFLRRAKNGRDVWLQASYTPILGADGKPFKVVKYATDVTARREQEALNAAFKGTLQTLGVNVTVADNDGRIIYVNDGAASLMREAEQDFRAALPQFVASQVFGGSVDQFDTAVPRLRSLLANLQGREIVPLQLGRRRIQLVANPMYDETRRRLGTALEWTDRTQEIATESELQQIITAVTAGDLEGRISLAGKTGFFETLSKGINDLVDSVATVVDEVQSLVSAANDGDLTKRVQLEGRAGLLVKIGSGINQLTDNMAGLVSRVKSAAGEVSRGADEISQGNTNLSQRTEEQASSLEETASSMEQMTSTVKQNADNAGQANQLAVAARDQAEKGGAVVSRAVKAMTEINESSKRIADIIGVIDEIAFQTNLLALNAAVEAARAGEQGRGFAVVASEVRNLAGRSATAAKEIKALIQDSVKKVDEGSSLVTQSGATLEQIVSAVKKVTDIVAEIAAASHEQSSGIEQVNKAVMQLDELTQQNAALVEEASAASQAMAEQARGLNDALAKYSVDDRVGRQATEAAIAVSSSSGLASRQPVPRRTSPAKAAPAVERRGESRPWQGSERSATNPTPVARATGTDDAVWQEF